MKLRMSVPTFLTLIAILVGWSLLTPRKPYWYEYNPYDYDVILARLQAGEIVDDVCWCGFYSINMRDWLIEDPQIDEEVARRFCPGLSEFDSHVQARL